MLNIKSIIIIIALTGFTYGQSVEVKDNNDDVLISVNEEGSGADEGGSITLPDAGSVGTTTDKLYNIGHNLYWQDGVIGTVGGGDGDWTINGINQYSTVSGNIGIGTTNPGYKLDVYGNYGWHAPHNFQMRGTGEFSFDFADGDGNDYWHVWDPVHNSILVARNDGNVGIGTINPIATLHVSSDDGALFTGTFGSGTIPMEGAGTRMMWYPTKAAFRSGNVDSDQWNDTKIGNYSTALGANTTASGIASTALGVNTTASGDNTTAMGIEINAESYASVALGRFNVGGGTNNTWLDADPLFEIGFGSSDVTRRNAITVLKNGKVGIGTNNPNAKFHVDHDDGVLFTGTYGSGSFTLPTSAGSRMIWYSKKAAFRAGYVEGTQWEDSNIGNYSTAFGKNTKASGASSTAMGFYTTASGAYSFAIGNGTNATGSYSTSMGSNTNASGTASTAIGSLTIASGNYSTAAGHEIEASGDYTFAIALNDQNGTSVTQNNTMAIMGGNVGIGTTSPKSIIAVVGLKSFANNAAAITGGLAVGDFYRTGGDPDLIAVVH